MFADYFSTYYLHLQYGTIFVTANYFIAVMLPVLFAGPLRRPRAWAKLAGLILLSCAGIAGPLRRPRAWAKLAGLILLSCAGRAPCFCNTYILHFLYNIAGFA